MNEKLRTILQLKTIGFAVIGAIFLIAIGPAIINGFVSLENPTIYYIMLICGLIFAEMIYLLDIFNFNHEHGQYEDSFITSLKLKILSLIIGLFAGIGAVFILSILYYILKTIKLPLKEILEWLVVYVPYILAFIVGVIIYIRINMFIKKTLFKTRRTR